MAKRPVFVVSENVDLVQKVEVDFTYYNGFSVAQKQRCIESLHKAFLKHEQGKRVLEISSKSREALGVKLSAFNLTVQGKSGKPISVECMFQSSKVFEQGGPYTDLLYATSREAKKDVRLKNSGKLIGFQFNGKEFPCEPKTMFYNWVYINTLLQNKELARESLNYDAFTDIEFNPQKSLNCQAEAVAIYVSLVKQGLLEIALQDKANFSRIVYGEKQEKTLFAEQ